jgi:hypothetical protein
VAQWNVEDVRQQPRIVTLRRELAGLRKVRPQGAMPWDSIYWASEKLSLEAQELTAALLIELYPDLVDELAEEMGNDQPETIDGAMTVAETVAAIERDYRWAIAIDFDDKKARKYFWYYSEGKEEPRLGERFAEAGAEREMRLGMAFYVKSLHEALKGAPGEELMATFLLRDPEHRLAARRVQTAGRFPYSEIRDNTIGDGLLPIDLLRAKLAFFGASKFDPKSDLWTRITMYQGAPFIDELGQPDADDWWLPAFAE